ncbi:hypothetical protein COSHB9_17770 [Companilactobacillus alimentarius]
MIMLKFGKKRSFRPLIIILVLGLFLGLAFNDIFSPSIGFIFGVSFFLLVFLGYYWRTSAILFNYWEVDDKSIRYKDMSLNNCLLMMTIPSLIELKSFSKDSIESITIHGNLENVKSAPFALLYNGALGIFSGSVAMAQNQASLAVTLKNGQKINLDFSRDLIYNKKETLEKLDKLFDSLDSNVKIYNRSNSHSPKLSY